MHCNLGQFVNQLKLNKDAFSAVEKSFMIEWDDRVHDSFNKYIYNRRKNLCDFEELATELLKIEDELNSLKAAEDIMDNVLKLVKDIDSICNDTRALINEISSIGV